MRILIVEDLPDQAYILQIMLNKMGCETVVKYDPFEAMEAVKWDNIDAVITDLCMPIMDGVELFKRIREFSDIPIIISSCFMDYECQKICKDINVNGYLYKPIMLNDLKNVINNLLN